MQLSIDERQCSKYHLTPQQVLVALAVRSSEDFKALWKDLLDKEAIVKHGGQWMITQRWNDRVDDILRNLQVRRRTKKDSLRWLKE